MNAEERAAEYALRFDRFVAERGIDEDDDFWGRLDYVAWAEEVEKMRGEGVLL